MQTPSPHLNTVTSEAIITAKKKYLLCTKNIVKNAIYHGTLPCLYMLNWKKQYTPAPKYMHIHILLQECLYTLTPMHACIYKCAIVYTCTCTIFFFIYKLHNIPWRNELLLTRSQTRQTGKMRTSQTVHCYLPGK